MTNFLNFKVLSQKCNALLINLATLPHSSTEIKKHVYQWDPALQIPAYIRRAHKK